MTDRIASGSSDIALPALTSASGFSDVALPALTSASGFSDVATSRESISRESTLASNGPRYDFSIHTYGCKVNTYDTGLLQKRLEKLGHKSVANDQLSAAALAAPATSTTVDAQAATATPGLSSTFGLGARTPRVHILNTCAVTGEATREATKAVRRLKSKDPFATVVVTGCGAQVDGDTFDTLPGADLVVANSHKGYLERLLDQHFKGELESKVFRSNIFRKDDLEAGGGIEEGHTRAFLKIQDGCNSFCTYCVIPFARGKSRSIPAAELAKRIRELEERGAKEVVLTGVHVGDYEDKKDAPLLHNLIEYVLEKTSIPRIRLTSLEPVELTPELLRLYKISDRLCPHFHMSIQSANTQVLALMKRKYEASHVEESLLQIASEVPGAFVGMDVIVGFPGEGEDEFVDTYERLARLPWTRIHVFPYSERPGTKAAKFEGIVAREVRTLRSQRLRELSSARLAELARKQEGATKRSLVLKVGASHVETLTRDYWPVRIAGQFTSEELHAWSHLKGQEIDIRVKGYDDSQQSRMDGVLIGERI